MEHELTIERKLVNYTGRDRPAMAVNGSIPGPTLRFREGDDAVIHVRNKLDVATSVHWHGLLLPNDQDGVPNLTYPPIEPGATFTYRFPIKHSGTYWYHSHSGLQEQEGVYGSILIEPVRERYPSARDEIILFSDWSDEAPHDIMRTLKRGSEWYAIERGSAQSLLGAARADGLGSFFKRELSRMPPMDIADVAYDRFLANGQPSSHIPAEPGELLRLRLIDGSATTYFFIEFAGGPMQIISSDGIDVEPFEESRFLIAVAETYDALVRVPPAGGRYELRATAHDGSGHASVWIGSGTERHYAPKVPRPDLYTTMGGVTLRSMFALTPQRALGMSDRKVIEGAFDEPGMKMSAGTDMEMEGSHGGSAIHRTARITGARPAHEDSGGHWAHPADVSARDIAIDGVDPRRPWPDYRKLRALAPTNFPEQKPRRDFRLTLDGDMKRYVWLLNNKALHEEDKITVHKGEIARFFLVNRTMMHHPMHLHGHFFRVVNGQGDYSPLKHTVNVAPMSTTIIEFDANDSGDWFFHCHLLYHMHSGMARIVHYADFEPSAAVSDVRHNLLEDPWYLWADVAAMSHMTEGNLTLSSTRHIFNAYWQVGWGQVDEAEYEIDLTYDYSLNRFSSVFGGVQLTNEEAGDRGLFGVRHTLPLLVAASAWIDTEGDFRLGAIKSLPITSRLEAFGELEYDTSSEWEWAVGAEYIVSKRLSVVGQYHSEFGFGAGLGIRF